MGHLQQTSALAKSIASVPIDPITGALNGLSNLGQNYQLFKIQNSLNQLNTVTNLTAATSFLNLGLCAAGFFLLNEKINNLDTKISNIDRKLDFIISKNLEQELAIIENAIYVCTNYYTYGSELHLSPVEYIKPISDLIQERLHDPNLLNFFNKNKADLIQVEQQIKTLQLLININIQLILFSNKNPIPFMEETIKKISKIMTIDKESYFNLLKIQITSISPLSIETLKKKTLTDTNLINQFIQGVNCKLETMQTLKIKSIPTSKYIEDLKKLDEHDDFIFLPI